MWCALVSEVHGIFFEGLGGVRCDFPFFVELVGVFEALLVSSVELVTSFVEFSPNFVEKP